MNFSGLLIFLVSSILLCSLTQSTQEPNFAAADCSGDTYTADSTYRSNLGRLLTELFHGNGFYKTSFGLKPDEIYGLYMCRGDITPEECKACVSTAQGNITQACPNQTTAIIWYDLCMLQYSDNLSILSTVQHSPDKALWNVNSMDSSQFRQNVRSQIYSFYGSYAYAPGLPPPGRSPPLGPPSPGSSYGAYTPARALLGQSSPGPSSGAEQPPTVLLGLGSSSGAEQPLAVLLGPGSSSGTEQPEGSSSGADQPLAPGNGTISSTIIIIITIVLATATIILLSVIYICLRKQKKRRKPKSDTDAATSNFADLNKLGQGGFGPVFKGKFSNGQEIAVKRLSKDSGQGEVEFKNEVMLLAKLQHKNLVQLLGFSLHGKEKLLVYEFLPNTSLDHFIFDPIKRAHLKWKTRLKIIRGIAGGLLYLHEESRLKIIHRDLKASNILLDEKMNPKISDFGMARLCVVDETQNTNKVVGTYGYMAPEYAMHGLFSVKSDVFSFGVLLLEIVSGRKNSSFYQSEHTEDLISFAWKNWTANKLLELIDTILIEDCSMSEMKRCIHIGFLCVQENPADRPTMASVDLMFKSSSITLPVPSPPAFFFQNTRLAEGSSSQTDLWVTEQVPSTSKSTQRSINDESSIELSPGEIHGDGGSPSRKEAVCEITSY